ncbi:SCO3242 family prenyltransferase [Streptomyces sp. LN785]|uniref:SCO3242 family prenyltransferase n=1 Tax=Streptomyces sp. LN785 TaxID=3112983 RepID=UPI0037155963
MTATLRAWAELLRVSALFTVPGDALAGSAAVGLSVNRGTLLATGASLCLYEAGMALNDWADRDEDAVDRPHRPIPSGRISPAAALTAAGTLTAAGLGLAARAGRPALAVATGLAATVWAYDLRLKHSQAGPAAMATARALDLLLGATATATGTGTRTTAGTAGTARTAVTARADAKEPRTALPVRTAPAGAALRAAALLGAHTYVVTAVSRHEAQGGSTAAPLAALAATVALGAATVREQRGTAGPPTPPGPGDQSDGHRGSPAATRFPAPPGLLLPALSGVYLRTAAKPLLHAALNPSPPLTQRAVGSGIRAMIPLQAALAARAGAARTGLTVMALVPLARALARKVSPT